MIGVGLRRGVFAAAGEVLGEGDGVAGRGVWLFDALTPATGDAVGVATAFEADSKLIAPEFHICARFEAFISISIGIRLGLAGCSGSVIRLPLISNWADWASDFE